jgi:hypothetical protein
MLMRARRKMLLIFCTYVIRQQPKFAPAISAYRQSMAAPENAPAFPAYRPSMAIKNRARRGAVMVLLKDPMVQTGNNGRSLRPAVWNINARRSSAA